MGTLTVAAEVDSRAAVNCGMLMWSRGEPAEFYCEFMSEATPSLSHSFPPWGLPALPPGYERERERVSFDRQLGRATSRTGTPLAHRAR